MSTSINRKRIEERKARKAEALQCIINCVHNMGLFGFSVEDAAIYANQSPAIIYSYFGGVRAIREQVLVYAKENEITSITNTSVTDMLNS